MPRRGIIELLGRDRHGRGEGPAEVVPIRPPDGNATGAGGAAEAVDGASPPAGPARIVPLRARRHGAPHGVADGGGGMTDRQFAAACRRIYGAAADVLEPEAWLAYCRTLRRNTGSAGTSDEERLALIKLAADHARGSRG